MSSYNLRAAEVLKRYEDTTYKMIDVIITVEKGKFLTGASSYRVTANDGLTTVTSLMAPVSANGKEIHAFFTTDAFAAMPGPISFAFSYGHSLGIIENVNIAAILTQLPPFLAALAIPDADDDSLAPV